MRTLQIVLIPALLSGCVFKVEPGSPSQSELEEMAQKRCNASPNTEDQLACRRRNQDSWRNAPEPPRDPVRLPATTP